jgi:hypothetical protein
MTTLIGEYVWRTLAQVRRWNPYLLETAYEAVGVAPHQIASLSGSKEYRSFE